jgi:hypothetical protein
MTSEKVLKPVTPAKAGVYNTSKRLDSGFRRNDEVGVRATFYETVHFKMAPLSFSEGGEKFLRAEAYPIKHQASTSHNKQERE